MYHDNQNWLEPSLSGDIICGLSSSEAKRASQHKLIEGVIGKHNKQAPLLIGPDAKTAMELLHSQSVVGVKIVKSSGTIFLCDSGKGVHCQTIPGKIGLI